MSLAQVPVVFLHGIGGGAAGFEAHVALLGRHGREAFAWNQPGYGGTAPVEPYTFTQVARALLSELDARGIARCIPVGHSMGGMIAQELHALAPERIAAMVLMGTSPAFGSPGGDFQQRFIAERTRPLDEGRSMAQIAERLVPTMLSAEASEAARDAGIALMSAVPPDTYRQAVAALVQFDRRAQLADIAVPVLCLAASLDRTAAPEVLQKMAMRIPGARYECLEGLGHLAPTESPERYCAAVLRFLESLE